MIFTSGTTGEAKPVVHTHGCLPGQRLQADNWFGARPGEVAWCTAASGWSKSARNVFLTPWLCGAAAVLHDQRFDPEERMATIAAENVGTLCMAPTEYRVIARRTELSPIPSLRQCVSAGEALNAEIFKNWHDGLGVDIRDGYGQTETGAITAVRPGDQIKPGSMGRPMPGIETRIVEGELWVDPTTVPTFFTGYGTPGSLERAGAARPTPTAAPGGAPATSSRRTRTTTSGSTRAATTSFFRPATGSARSKSRAR